MTTPLLALLLVLQQPSAHQQPGANRQPWSTSPPSGDTIGYWQQRISYRIVATLDETGQRLRARGELVYVNNSPDTLREMYLHQYLNAFRPGSKWSDADEREGRVRFQRLRDPDYGYERFTTPPTVDGAAVFIDYPGAPDSTVAHFRLPRPLAPHDSVRVGLDWEARPSTTPRRQGRRGRTYDFAQWYPKVAVYDRAGWEPHPLLPAGELYGEYGTYDVTMVVRDDQVLASTGVPVSGDPGWERVKRWGEVRLARDAYSALPPAPNVEVPAGSRAVRFVARDVHHFAWSASPDYRYEGAVYVRPAVLTHYPTWDTVSIHVLYKPADDTTWGGGRAVNRTLFALKWLESIWGTYAYPQMSNVHRLDGGGTEFPMMIMDGSASQGLILHEGGHIFTYGILGNNEWRSGWMDEGFTSYQSSWALRTTPQERVAEPPPAAPMVGGYRANAVTMPPAETENLSMLRLELSGRTEPLGKNSEDFRDFVVYNLMIYDRAELMYSHLRDVLGDTAFKAFMHDYYNRWTLKHVDELAMRSSAERVSGRELQWFFDEWVRKTGLLDYSLDEVRTTQRPDGQWLTRAELVLRGGYEHPIAVGAHTSAGWTLIRGNPASDRQIIQIVTAQRPDDVRIDPFHVTWDWDRRNDKRSSALLGIKRPRAVFDWPFLQQADRERSILALFPMLWLAPPSDASRCSAGVPDCRVNKSALTVGARARSSYLALVDQYELGFAMTTGASDRFASRLNAWARVENPYVPFSARPLMGVGADAAFLDGIWRMDLRRTWDLSRSAFAPSPRILATARFTGAYPTDRRILPEQWANEHVTEVGGDVVVRMPITFDSGTTTFRASLASGLARERGSSTVARGYVRAEASATRVAFLESGTFAVVGRLYGAASSKAPLQRAIYASTADPFETFWNHWFRPQDAFLKHSGTNFQPLGGAALRGYDYRVPLERVGAANLEIAERVLMLGTERSGRQSLWVSAFGDFAGAASADPELHGGFLADVGAGVALRGRLYDRDIRIRLDFPLLVKQPGLSIGEGRGGNGSIALRWALSFSDLW